jgi:hypothetical protein
LIAKRHTPQTKTGYLQTGIAETSIQHGMQQIIIRHFYFVPISEKQMNLYS